VGELLRIIIEHRLYEPLNTEIRMLHERKVETPVSRMNI
jgi:hypothetical protein